jgi:hypothetical protein
MNNAQLFQVHKSFPHCVVVGGSTEMFMEWPESLAYAYTFCNTPLVFMFVLLSAECPEDQWNGASGLWNRPEPRRKL